MAPLLAGLEPLLQNKRHELGGLMRTILILLSGLLVGCSPNPAPADKEIAAIESAAKIFHKHLADGDHAAIYAGADEDFRARTTRENLAGIATKYRNGTVGCGEPRRDPTQVTYKQRAMIVGEGLSGRFITVVYRNACGPRTVTETLMFKLRDGSATLVGVHFDGPQFEPELLAPTPEPGHTLPPLPPSEPETAPAAVPPNAG